MVKRILLVTLTAVLLCPMAALADFYMGAAIGNSWQSATVDADEIIDEAQEIDENSTSWKAFAGFKGQSFIGIEGGYRDLGKIKAGVEGQEFSAETKGWDIEALAHIELSIIDFFAKAGAFFWNSDVAWSNHADGDDGTSFIWGLGAGISLGSVGVRLEWESFEVDTMDNLSMLSLGATLGF